MATTFTKLYEETLNRMQQGGLLEGDYVKIVKNWMKNPKIKEKSEGYLKALSDMTKSELPVKISAIKAERSESANGVVGSADAPTAHWADIITEYAPGLFTNVMTVPLEILQKIETGANFSPGIPKSWVRPNKTNIKPIAVKQSDPNRNLPTKNTKIK